MILHSQSLSKFVLIRGNSWLSHSRHSETPDQPILPKLPENHGVIAQNKPNSQNKQIPTTSFPSRAYTNLPLRPTPKNKPNQTQFPGANMRQQARSVSAGVPPKPDPSPIHKTTSDIRYTTLSIAKSRCHIGIRSIQLPLDAPPGAEDNLDYRKRPRTRSAASIRKAISNA